MNKVKRLSVWLSRVRKCRGFGVQSPSAYEFIRYVVNEHYPYYAYVELDKLTTDWLTRKLGRLYFRLANWRQPTEMQSDDYDAWWSAGCRKTRFLEHSDAVELLRIVVGKHHREALDYIYNKVNDQTLLVVEGIWRDNDFWKEIVADERTGVTFDLYYCGIVFFDKKRTKQHYVVNF